MSDLSDKKPDNSYDGIMLSLLLLPMIMFGLFGGFLGSQDDDTNFLSGFLWGIASGAVLIFSMWIGLQIWEWIKKEANNGKLPPFLLLGFIAAIAISGYFAVNLGRPSCDVSNNELHGSCEQYADDGFEATSAQKWDRFWDTLPVTTIIAMLIAVIVRSEKKKKKS